ncbi:MAG: glycosyltransferase [Clostridiaceae bacterium]|nr:glycosyltransferase [Clostridiaceae bacterium]
MNIKIKKVMDMMIYTLVYYLSVKIHRPLKSLFSSSARLSASPDLFFDIIIPVYKVNRRMLRHTLQSVKRQRYQNWQAILIDANVDRSYLDPLYKRYEQDKRFTILHLDENKGISGNTNIGLTHISGQYVVFVDQDDLLDLNALQIIAHTIIKHDNPDLLYTDEDKIIGYTGLHLTPHFKPDWNPELLLSRNYITHLAIYKRELIQRTGILSSECDGSQDYDYVLRASEKAGSIIHIPQVLYHWRIHRLSSARKSTVKTYTVEAGRLALERCYTRRNINVVIACDPYYPGLYHTLYQDDAALKISLILLPDSSLTQEHVFRLLDHGAAGASEIIIPDHFFNDEQKILIEKRYQKSGATVLWDSYAQDRSTADQYNHLAAKASCDLFLFMSAGLRPESPEWMQKLANEAIRDKAGFVAPLITGNENKIQGPALAVDRNRGVMYLFNNADADDYGYFARMKSIQDVTAFTDGCLMIRRSIFYEINQFSQSDASTMIITALQGNSHGYKNILVPQVRMKLENSEPGIEEKKQPKKEALAVLPGADDLIYQHDPYYPSVFSKNGQFAFSWNRVYRQFIS